MAGKETMELDLLGDLRRTHFCGELRSGDDGKPVVLMGWVNRRRDHGELIFLDVRDRYGVAQVVLDRAKCPEAHAKAESVRPEYVVAVRGKVRRRGAAAVNAALPTGDIEVGAEELRILNDAKTPPFSPAEDAISNEEMRLKYRYVDLRRPAMQQNLILRHRVVLAIRQFLSERGFLEIETPYLTRSTPEGARDYLVPSRTHPGEFYALPQSPQLFKQILMISGLDRYFQVARCFRDEDLRADRQPEFTQIDLEMTFPQPEQVFRVIEGVMAAAFKAAGIRLPVPFPQIAYDDSIRRFGTDKPDLRLPELTDVRSVFSVADLESLAVDPSLPMIALRVPKVGELTRREREENRPLFDGRKAAKLIDDWKRLEKGFPEAAAKIREQTGAAAEDLLLIVAGDAIAHAGGSEWKTPGRLNEREIAVYAAAGALRAELAKKYAERHGAFDIAARLVQEASWGPGRGLLDGSQAFFPIWVTDFPMFERDAETGAWAPAHHPFTAPHEEDMERLTSDPASVRARYYDLAMNGLELGSGSIRIHRQDIQKKIFESLGMSDEEAKDRFGFFLEALEYGTPPHGGIALGLDRIVMILAGADSLREVIAFPKTARAVDLMSEAPSTVREIQWKELHLQPRRG